MAGGEGNRGFEQPGRSAFDEYEYFFADADTHSTRCLTRLSMTLKIVPLQESHFANLHRVLDVVARENRYFTLLKAPPLEECCERYRSILLNDQCLFVAELDGEVVGWCDILPVRGDTRTHVGLLGMGMYAALRHRGIGQQLMQAAIGKAWEKGLTRIELTVRVDNTNAKALYERMGFQFEGVHRRANQVDGEFFDTVSMALLR
jgi:RimJ/RimL family protein N-acetyltransferase